MHVTHDWTWATAFSSNIACCLQAAYDKICEAKKREAKRDRELDEQRKKFKLGESVTRKAPFGACILFLSKHIEILILEH